jgi:hypothetical protein
MPAANAPNNSVPHLPESDDSGSPRASGSRPRTGARGLKLKRYKQGAVWYRSRPRSAGRELKCRERNFVHISRALIWRSVTLNNRRPCPNQLLADVIYQMTSRWRESRRAPRLASEVRSTQVDRERLPGDRIASLAKHHVCTELSVVVKKQHFYLPYLHCNR